MPPVATPNISSRKDDHLRLCLDEDVESLQNGGWDKIRLPHRALPEIDYSEIDTSAQFLGIVFSSPILISSMTGGSPEGDRINSELADFAQTHNIPMGVGSQRVFLKDRSTVMAELRKKSPRATLLANIGIVQFNYGVGADDCKWLIDQLEASALILHANALQEAIQSEGDRNFSDLFSKIEELRKSIDIPIILKETGCGLDVKSCKEALNSGIDVLDIAGMGGTHWGFIEGLRSQERKELGEIFRDWGIPSAEALENARNELGPKPYLIASGGLRNGLDLARALYIGANFCGMALPFLQAATRGREELETFYKLQTEALKIALFAMGQSSVKGCIAK